MSSPPPQKSTGLHSSSAEKITLTHLEPFEFRCPTPDGNSRRVRVRFSPHVFTRKYEDDDPYEGVCFGNRIFCPIRYEDSFLLQDIITELPDARVYQTWEKRNYVFLAVETPQRDDRYHLFFSIKKVGSKRNRHIEMWIESAYRQENSRYAPPHRPNSVRFKVLVQSVFMERSLDFAPR